MGSFRAVVRRAIFVALVISFCGVDAHAHGGRFRGPGGMVPPGRSRGAMTFDDWSFWLHHNIEPIENRVFAGKTRAPLGDAVKAKALDTVIAMLSSPKLSGHQDTQSAAVLALARMSEKDAAHIQLLKLGLDKRKKTDWLVREASALSLGLLRRDDPKHQLDAAVLDAIRDDLFTVFDDEDYQSRTRGFAAVALGMLGDQPTGASEGGSHALRTTARIFERIDRKYRNLDLNIGMLLALRSQPLGSLTDGHRETLRGWIREHLDKVAEPRFSNLVAGYVTLALGSVGTNDDVDLLLRTLTKRGTRTHSLRPCSRSHE